VNDPRIEDLVVRSRVDGIRLDVFLVNPAPERATVTVRARVEAPHGTYETAEAATLSGYSNDRLMLWFREGYPRTDPPDVEDVDAEAWIEGGSDAGNGTSSQNETDASDGTAPITGSAAETAPDRARRRFDLRSTERDRRG
jgi:hypothetical protein